MIYQKECNFPYPILSNLTNDYIFSNFTLDITLKNYEDEYEFLIYYTLNSPFITQVLSENKAKMYIVIESKDAKIYELINESIKIKKNRISLSKTTKIQLFIVASSGLSFANNDEIDSFYNNVKSKLFLKKGNILAISNVVKFDGNMRKPFDLFIKQFDPNIRSEIQVVLGTEMIKIKYKDKRFQFNNFRRKNTLNNHYVYIGLTKALLKFLFDLGEGEEFIYLNEIDEPEENILYKKIYHLLMVKNIELLSFENIDEVINDISDNIIEKHYFAIKELNDNAN